MTEKEALGLAIFALNTLLYPDASSPLDSVRLDKDADEALAILVRLRDKEGQL